MPTNLAYHGLDDATLISRCVSWDPGAWEALLSRHGSYVQAEARRQLFRYLGRATPADVEDASQEVLSVLLHDGARTLRQFRLESSLSTWLFCVIRSVCRRMASRNRSFELLAEEAVAPVPPELELHPELLHEALARLSRRDQRLLRLFFSEGRKYREIALELKISINSVGPLLSRALAMARRQLAR